MAQQGMEQKRGMNNPGRKMNQNQGQNQNQGRRSEKESFSAKNMAIGGLKSLALKVIDECRPGFEKARSEAMAGFERGIGEMRQGVERAWSEVVHTFEGAKERLFSSEQKNDSTLQ